jgi:adenosylhomocysteine nucleosidase
LGFGSLDLSFSPLSMGIVFALPIEAACFADMLGNVRVTRGDGFVARQGSYGKRPVVVVESGTGERRAAKATHAMIDAYRPRFVASAGFAGGLDPQVRRNDLVLANSLIRLPSPSGGGRAPCTHGRGEGGEMTLELATLLPRLGDVPNLHQGRLLTADRVIRRREEKLQLGRQHAALAVDMETFVVAEVCRRRGVEFLSVRAISDAADDELPADIGKLLAQKSFAAQLGAAVGSIFRRPASVKDLFNLHQSALACSKRLATFLRMLLEHMG